MGSNVSCRSETIARWPLRSISLFAIEKAPANRLAEAERRH
jgi:hypothetical protein